MCGASQVNMLTNGSEWNKEVMSDSFILVLLLEDKLECVEWSHCLATIDISTLNHGAKLSNEDGNVIVSI